MAIKIIEYKIAELYTFKIAILLMFLSSFTIRYLVILVYDYIKIDWLLIENFKEKQSKKQTIINHTAITRKILKLKKIGKGRVFVFIVLVCTDPVITVLYYREGHHQWNNIPSKNFMLFFISAVICTITLAGAIYSIMGLIDLIF
ncbi:MAG: hypothetical protein JJE53_03050 [Candidatus Pacebacteria bacterium]|nr:hypothetical protein [Candidatus Paceibacterota bacterium]